MLNFKQWIYRKTHWELEQHQKHKWPKYVVGWFSQSWRVQTSQESSELLLLHIIRSQMRWFNIWSGSCWWWETPGRNSISQENTHVAAHTATRVETVRIFISTFIQIINLKVFTSSPQKQTSSPSSSSSCLVCAGYSVSSWRHWLINLVSRQRLTTCQGNLEVWTSKLWEPLESWDLWG